MAKWFTLAVLGATVTALPLASAAEAQDVRSTGFTVADKNFTVAVPEGYCLPEGADKALAEAFANIDSLNFTHANLRSCTNPEVDYSIVKSERNAQPIGIPKAMFIALAAKQLESELGQQQLAQGIDSGSVDVAKGTGEAITINSGSARAGGFDDDCVYILGTVVVAAGTEQVTTNFATCLTLAGQRVFAVHSYADAGSDVSFDALKARSRAIGASIAPTA
ncbi:MAG: hypothetical protein O9266_07585 [Porphyrobacter sp.]|jgi:hypothetical protein|nr:hypothetical protein [Porphyrobacter sp.]